MMYPGRRQKPRAAAVRGKRWARFGSGDSGHPKRRPRRSGGATRRPTGSNDRLNIDRLNIETARPRRRRAVHFTIVSDGEPNIPPPYFRLSERNGPATNRPADLGGRSTAPTVCANHTPGCRECRAPFVQHTLCAQTVDSVTGKARTGCRCPPRISPPGRPAAPRPLPAARWQPCPFQGADERILEVHR